MTKAEFNENLEKHYDGSDVVMASNVIIETPEGSRYPLNYVPKWLQNDVAVKEKTSTGITVYLVTLCD